MQTILLVEDNDMNRDMLARRLTRKGFFVVAAEDGQQGIDYAIAEQPALILMDLSLPVVDGWEATRQLKANAMTKHIPIIVLTAHAMKEDEEKAYQAGCDDYDTKPIILERLLEKMTKALAGR
ncbi:response regulator [Metasolibacillus fluoroglycofenilyticus]|uniref:response regulator n=1 Tax=Metasolibacillus fluoroglycofenilyticus TaxID=1239396 RepID=UPI000D381CE8|nr:response regulator [Metasolibacillus fluoroglycofenilyticus]